MRALASRWGGTLLCACALLLGPTAGQALGEEHANHLYDRFQGSASGSLLWLGADARIDARDGSVGTDLNVEDDLGLTRTKFQPRLEFRWRPGRRHQLGIGYQVARRSAEKALIKDIEVGDTSFVAGLRVRSVFDSDNLFLTYRLAIMARERTQLGVGLGLGAFFFRVGVDALAGVTAGGDTVSAQYGSTKSFIGPTAAIGLFGRFRVSDRWYLEPDLRYLQVSIDRVTAKVIEGGATAQYYLSPKVGIEGGIGIRGVKVDIGPKTDGGLIDLSVSARVKFTETQFRLGVVLPI